jgi:hypothetical protein
LASAEISLILENIDRAFDKRSWHGTNLRGVIRGLSVGQAAWRPVPERHNIWELTLHAAYWKYAVKRHLLNEEKGGFPIEGSNFIKRPTAGFDTENAWKADVKLLGGMHKQLRSAVAALKPKDLDFTPPDSKVGNREILLGIAAHDLYHAGQIQLIKRMWKSS